MNGRASTRADLVRLAALYPDHPSAEVAAALGRTVASVYNMAHKLGLKKSPEFVHRSKVIPGGEPHQFPKGHVPANKGLRRPGYSIGRGRMSETQFKKGQRSQNWRPVGTICADADGFYRIKVRERRPGDRQGWDPDVWPLLHWLVYEVHHGPIPPKHVVRFKDGNRQNCAIENLELISMAENGRRNTMWRRYPREVSEAIQLNGVLKRKLRRLDGKK